MTTKIDAEIEVRADTSDAKKKTDELEKSFTKAFAKGALLADAMGKAVGLLKDGLIASVNAALEFERTQLKLRSAIKNVGGDVEVLNRAFDAQSKYLQNVTGFSDETIREMQALALNMGVSAGQTDEFVQASIRLSNATGMDATQAMKGLVKTLSGMKGELGEAIPAVGNLTEKQLRNGDAVKIINKEMSESLGILTEGTGGSMKGLVNAWDDLSEAVGKSAIEFVKASGAMQHFTDLAKVWAFFLEEKDFSFWDLAGLQSGEELHQMAREIDNLMGQRKRLADAETKQMTLEGKGGGKKFAGKRKDQFNEKDILADIGAGADQWGKDEEARLQVFEDWYKQREDLAERHYKMEASIREYYLQQEIAKEEEWQEQKMQITSAVYGAMTETVMSSWELWIKGGKVTADKILADFMWAIGKQLIAMGIQDVFEGGRRVIASYYTDATGYKLGALGAAEIAGGALLMKGSTSISGMNTGGGGGGGGGGGSRASRGGGGGGGGSYGRNAEAPPINIVVQGSMTNEETMLAVRRALAEAR